MRGSPRPSASELVVVCAIPLDGGFEPLAQADKQRRIRRLRKAIARESVGDVGASEFE